ncbi:MAG TPA: hypothetical protein VFI74_02135 [Candidatus Saccharimonadales bacterium]|nr:hypothetical protein [Candidatus Saccharimonadales bacterium]
MATPITLPESKPTGPDWHNSHQKYEQDAFFVTLLRPVVTPVAAQAVLLLSKHGYYPFVQERVRFPLAKMQVMESQDEPLENNRKGITVPLAKLIDTLSIDSFIEFCHVSDDPENPGEMAVFGGPRPQMAKEEARIERFLTRRVVDDYGTVSVPTEEDIEMYKLREKITPRIRPAIWGTTSTLGFTHQVGTYDYYRELVRRELIYYFRGDQQTDLSIFLGLFMKASEALTIQESAE